MQRPWRWLAIGFVVLSGCPEADIRLDGGGGPDAASVDAGDLDANLPDAGERDAGSTDAGVVDAGVADAGLPDPSTFEANVVFVTSETRAPGELGGIAAADALCNDLAMRAGLPDVGSYVAWLSTGDTHAVSRIATARGWVRRDGAPVVDSPMDLVEGTIWAPPSLDEMGARTSATVVTGTNTGGQVQTGTCGEWQSLVGETRVGRSGDGTRRWTSRDDQPCTRAAPIYCFGTGRLAPVEADEHYGRLVFRSRDRLVGSDGRDAMDAACQRDAEAAGFTGRTVVAFVSSASEAAIERLGEGEPWVRPDGVLVASTRSEISRQSLLAPITPSADLGGYRDDLIWVGSSAPDVRSAPGEDCNGWSDPTAMGRRGAAGASQSFFDGGSDTRCSTTMSVVCFEP